MGQQAVGAVPRRVAVGAVGLSLRRVQEGVGRRPAVLDSHFGLGGRIRSIPWKAKPQLPSEPRSPEHLAFCSGKMLLTFWEDMSEQPGGGIFAGAKRLEVIPRVF